MDMSDEKSPIIILPIDEKRVQHLRTKLQEYLGRFNGYAAPELQMGTICKIAVLKKLLEEGRVETLILHQEMVGMYGSNLDSHKFNGVCGVIDDYCKTGGQNTRGGTGLDQSC